MSHIEETSKKLSKKITLYQETEDNSKEKSNIEGNSERMDTDNKSSFIQRYDFKGSFLNEEVEILNEIDFDFEFCLELPKYNRIPREN